MNRIMKRALWMAAAVWAFGMAPTAQAVKMGDSGLNAELRLAVYGEYDSNLFISHFDRVSDTSLNITPGLTLSYGKISTVYADADVRFQMFNKTTDQNNVSGHATVGAKLVADLSKLKLENRFDRLTGPERDVGAFVKQNRNYSVADLEHNLSSKFAVGLDLENDYNTFVNPAYIDRNKLSGGATVFYKAYPKTDLLANFNYGYYDVMQAGANNINDYLFNIGMRGLLTGKTEAKIKVGYEVWDMQNAAKKGGLAIDAGLESSLTQTTKVDLNILRADRLAISQLNDWYTQTLIVPRIEQELLGRLRLELVGRYEQAAYEILDRTDNYWEGAAGLKYKVMKFYDVGVAYRYQYNDSSMSEYTYVRNVLDFGVTGKF